VEGGSVTRNSKTGATRVEYSEPEQLDKILDFLRRARDDAQAGRRRPVPYDPISDKIAMPSAPDLAEAHAESRQPTSPASDEPARRVPRQEPSFAAPKPDAASDPAPAREGGDDAPRGATEIAARARRGGIVSDGPAGTRRESHDSRPAPESDPVRLAEAQATPAPSDTPRSREAFAANGSAGPANRTRRPTAGTIGASTTVGPSEPDTARAGEAAKSAPARAPRASAAAPEPARANTAAPSGISLTRIASGSELFQAIAASRPIFVSLAVFSLVINVLMLAGPLFMLQVYDRVMSSGSISTLLVLSALTAAVYGVIGLLELVRSRLTVRIGVEVDRRIGDRVFHASLRQTLDKPGASLSALRDLDQLRQFVGGPGPLTLFDAPWTPVYLVVVFLLHWWLGIAATVGAVVLVAIAWMSETHSRKPLAEANKAAVRSIEIAESGQRNAEAITAMGMLSACRARWQAANAQSLAWQVLASDQLGTLSSISKALRLLLQSMMLAIGAALAIKGDLSAGSIVAATILFGRALAPVEQAVAQ
jgi:hypothetical protein